MEKISGEKAKAIAEKISKNTFNHIKSDKNISLYIIRISEQNGDLSKERVINSIKMSGSIYPKEIFEHIDWEMLADAVMEEYKRD